ncbi:hypothetical protein MKZ38_002922 [Zalerion maritima]|uniref:Uncharacterized protein n=1 Tax=Zalerion maritima TaxID=339359 RepID=A0AAD5RPD4_9PEZI|nr:hypothetical protein MKZ38_002922 [Zalerion maritima]
MFLPPMSTRRPWFARQTNFEAIKEVPGPKPQATELDGRVKGNGQAVFGFSDLPRLLDERRQDINHMPIVAQAESSLASSYRDFFEGNVSGKSHNRRFENQEMTDSRGETFWNFAGAGRSHGSNRLSSARGREEEMQGRLSTDSHAKQSPGSHIALLLLPKGSRQGEPPRGTTKGNHQGVPGMSKIQLRDTTRTLPTPSSH